MSATHADITWAYALICLRAPWCAYAVRLYWVSEAALIALCHG